MKRAFQLMIVLCVGLAMISCKSEEKTSGEEACNDAAGEYLEELESCLNALGYTLGEDPDDMAEEFCEDECDDLDNKVKTSDVDACLDEIGDMDCEELIQAFSDDSIDIDNCEWIEDNLGC